MNSIQKANTALIFLNLCFKSLLPERLVSIAPRTRAIDRFSSVRHQPKRALANQNAAAYLRLSGRLSIRLTKATKCGF